MNPSILLAVFDIETTTTMGNGPGDIPWDDYDRIGFACGVVTWLEVSSDGRYLGARPVQPKMLHTNVYWSPATMIADLLRYPAVLVAYNGRNFDIPIIVHQAVRGWWNRTSRRRLVETLRYRLFDPLRWLEERTGHPHVCRLDWLREGMGRAELHIGGAPVPHVEIPAWWNAGRHWDVIEACRDDVAVLTELVLTGCAGQIVTNRLREEHDGRKVDLSLFETAGGAPKYVLPTSDWWNRLEDLHRRLTPWNQEQPR